MSESNLENIPPKRNNKESKWSKIVYRMAIGSNFFVPSLTEAKSLCYVLRYNGFQAIQRKLGYGYVVWKFPGVNSIEGGLNV